MPAPRPARARRPARRALARVRSLPRIPKDPLGFLQDLAREQGDVARINLGWRDLLLFTHPDAVHEVLVARNASFRGLRLARALLDQGLLSVDGAQHRKQRAMMKPAFHMERIRGYARLASATGERWASRWRDGEVVDFAEDMMQLTLDVTGQAMFGADRAAQARAIGEALTHSLEAFRSSPFAPWTARLPSTPTGHRFRKARARLDPLVYDAIRERRASAEVRHDLLAMLMDAKDEDGRGMTDQEVRDEALTLLVAGHETTALSLTWTWLCLAQNPDAQARLHEELDAVLGGRRPEVEDVPRLPYARQVIAEAMRLYPPVWALGRRAVEPTTVAGTRVRNGSIVIVSAYLTQHDARWWPEPEAFRPERFAGDAARERRTFFPFGGGPRVCLGEQLAWMEATLLLGTLAQRWRVHPTGAPVERMPLLTLQPKGGLPLRVEARRPGA